MSLTASEMTPADIAAVTGGGGSNGGWGDGNGAWWIIILFLFAAVGGWGNNGGGFGGGNGGGNNMTLPYLWNTATQADVNRGFDTAALSAQLSGIQSSLSNGFSTAEIAECNRAMDAMQTAYANQIASMNQSFANSQALDARLDNLAMTLQQCCCDNRAGIESLRYTIATENCADRAAVNDGVRDIIANQTAGIQTILDKLCDQELQAERRENANLRTQLNMATLAASQTAQTATIRAGQVEEVDALYNRLSNCPVPSMPVYGNQPIFTCPNNNNGCGCGCGNYGGFNGNF